MIALILLLLCCGVYGQGATDDKYILKGAGALYQTHVDDAGNTWTSAATLTRLNIMDNDELVSADVSSCGREIAMDSASNTLTFTEIAQTSGITHMHRPSIPVRPYCTFPRILPGINNTRTVKMPGEFCTIDYITGGAAAGDYNGDGMTDLFFTVATGRSVLYRNNGDGTYTDVTADVGVGPDKYGSGAGFFDVDQDGDLDIYVTTAGDTRHYLYINYGGHFKEEAVARNVAMETPTKRKLAGMTPSFGDYDNDGYLDIYTTEWIFHVNGKPSVSRLLRNMGATNPGHFVDMTDYAGVNMDIYWPRQTTFSEGTHTFGASFTDFDKDGYPELLVTADFDGSKLFWNNRNGTFRECTAACGVNANQDAMGHAIGDWNNDGNLDWFSSAIYENPNQCGAVGCIFQGEGNKLFSNNGDRTFREVTSEANVVDGGWGWGAAFLDFNNDGYLDLVHTNGFNMMGTTIDDKFSKTNMRLFENTKVATQPGNVYRMSDVASQYNMNFEGQGRGLLKADIDNDGDEDIVVAANYGPPKIFRNDGGNKKKWLKVSVKNICLQNSSRLCESYGAMVSVRLPDGKTQLQEIGSSSHFLGQSERIAHFGLGAMSGTVTVIVSWKFHGVTTQVSFVPTNTFLRVVRPASSQQISFTSLAKCPMMAIDAITQQPDGLTVAINPSGLSLNIYVPRDTHLANFGLKTFEYSLRFDPAITSAVAYKTKATVTLDLTPANYTDMCAGMPSRQIPPTDDRRFDGQSNNKKHTDWGSPNTLLKRLVHSDYADGLFQPAGGCGYAKSAQGKCPFADHYSGYGSHRPSPRLISNKMFAQTQDIPSARGMNDLTMHFGQFFSHDMDLTITLPSFSKQDIPNEFTLPIPVPKGDVQFDPQHTGNKSLPFLRSIFHGCTGVMPNGSPREQVNVITAYVDGSMVYGSSAARNLHLRSFVDGKLKQGADGILPKNNVGIANANVVGRDPTHLYMAGDTRANVQPGLIAMHALFVREHNRLAAEYKQDNPNANDEMVFQKARRLLISEIQAIAFNEYLPSLLGGKQHIPAYEAYKEDIEPTVTSMFGTAAFRFGHSQVNSLLFRLNSTFQPTEYGHALLRDSYFAPEKLADEGGLEPLLRGTMYFPAQELDTLMVDEMRNVLFPSGKSGGLDLAAMNIQRGRDHAIPDYNTVRKSLGLGAVNDFSEITSNRENAQKLKDLYQTVDNIDLWVGGLNEDHEPGSELGPVFRKILLETFLRARDGDRFWYQSILSQQEIAKVESMTLAKIIAANTNFKNVPEFSFFSMKSCSEVKDFQCVRKPELSDEALRRENELLKQSNRNIHDSYNRMRASYVEADNDKDDMRSLSIGLGVFAAFILVICLFLLLFVGLKAMSKKKGTRDVKAYTIHNPHTSSEKPSSNASSRSGFVQGFAYP